ncbi:hypothetical protein AGR7A_Lc10266 [Agrobacterium deltaense NCPPB 1641]|uniref:Uncharacterized protein n=1 Tax=Agrobacterium deltaense NCPPB 1641 TaxID=1183425 RepID=A0A1S7TSQ1_9HYPH|nr:hypothetical protein AGR7A_Lc10266 [Agrobacterium deltaense NCPPB 1641]
MIDKLHWIGVWRFQIRLKHDCTAVVVFTEISRTTVIHLVEIFILTSRTLLTLKLVRESKGSYEIYPLR